MLLHSGLSCSLLSVSGYGSGTVLGFGGFLGLAGVVWLQVGKFCIGYSSGHNLSRVARPFDKEEGSGDSGQDTVAQWNVIIAIPLRI